MDNTSNLNMKLAMAWADMSNCQIRRFAGMMAVSIACLWPVVASGEPNWLVNWKAGIAANSADGWSIERFGKVREASLRSVPEEIGAGAFLEATIASVDNQAPPAQLIYPVRFQAGHRYHVRVELSASTPLKVEVMMRRGPAPYDALAIRTVVLDNTWQTVEFEGAWPFDSDPGNVRIAFMQSQGQVLVRKLQINDLGLLPLGAIPVIPFPSKLIGIHVNQLGRHSAWVPMGVGLIRLVDTGTNWFQLAPTREDFDEFRGWAWKRLDLYVDYASRNDPSVSLLYTLGFPPAWASASPQADHCAYGKGTCGAPASLDEWRHYIRTLAMRYKGRIRYWELWNEPDNRQFFLPTRSLVDLAKAAHEELKAVDPLNQLVSPGFTRSSGLNWLNQFLEGGGGRYVDAIGFHWYYDGQPEKLAPLIHNINLVMKAHGVADKPLWNTEGSPLCQTRSNGVCVMNGLTTEEQDSVIERAMLTMWLNGIQAYAYYTLEGMGGRSIALLAADLRSPTQAALNLKTFSQWMLGAEAVAVSTWGREGHSLEFRRRDQRFYIAWTQSESQEMPIPPAWKANRYEVLGKEAASLPSDQELRVGRVPVLFSR